MVLISYVDPIHIFQFSEFLFIDTALRQQLINILLVCYLFVIRHPWNRITNTCSPYQTILGYMYVFIDFLPLRFLTFAFFFFFFYKAPVSYTVSSSNIIRQHESHRMAFTAQRYISYSNTEDESNALNPKWLFLRPYNCHDNCYLYCIYMDTPSERAETRRT